MQYDEHALTIAEQHDMLVSFTMIGLGGLAAWLIMVALDKYTPKSTSKIASGIIGFSIASIILSKAILFVVLG